ASYAMKETRALLKLAGASVAIRGILRLPISERQSDQMRAHIKAHGDVEEREEGFWIDSGFTVDIPAYLSGLWDYLKAQGAHLEKQTIDSLEALKEFDQVIIAAGAGTLRFPECKELPLQLLKGQTLLMEGEPSYPTSALGPGYLAHRSPGDHFEIGATYEREFEDVLPDLEKAKALLKAPLAQFGQEAKIIGCKAGIRVTVQGPRRPIIKRLDARTHLFTGLGSRGLLYHAYFAKFLVRGMLA
ncbi:MAG: hypothetical protein K940chlam2_00901, partial [Chlamydiae bacterium]|nr:hypothetical protein [Chlamydiota bacterium]